MRVIVAEVADQLGSGFSTITHGYCSFWSRTGKNASQKIGPKLVASSYAEATFTARNVAKWLPTGKRTASAIGLSASLVSETLAGLPPHTSLAPSVMLWLRT
ncbi:MAG: hypothetical protein HY396_01790 [Candidatus Doudnabacteria bacterium]|nr:hypothetical protein [Candidatus Doudnabacteria bacterium]